MEDRSATFKISDVGRMKALAYLLGAVMLVLLLINMIRSTAFEDTAGIVGGIVMYGFGFVMAAYVIYSSLNDLTFSIRFEPEFVYISAFFIQRKISVAELRYHVHSTSKGRGGTEEIMYLCKVSEKKFSIALPTNMERKQELEAKILSQFRYVAWK